MKISTLKIFALSLLALVMSSRVVHACNLSDLTLVSITGTGPYTIQVRLCVGMGLTGSTKGGDQSTNSIFFGFWRAAGPLTISSFLPASITGPKGCTMPGSNYGPDPYYGIQGEIQYTDPGYYGFHVPCTNSPYGCVNSNALCGNATAFCRNFTFVVNPRPDSMRAFGVEGGGNPVGGCYPNADMKLDLRVLPVVWGDIEGLRTGTSIKLKWSTMEEINADYFAVERAVDEFSFEEIGHLPAVGNSSSEVRYQFIDQAPQAGINRYRITQVDKTGASNDSETIEVLYSAPTGLSWGEVGPNPTTNLMNISYYSPINDAVSFQLRDVTGKLAMSFESNATIGGNSMSLDLSKVNAGTYYLSLTGKNDRLVRKVIKL